MTRWRYFLLKTLMRLSDRPFVGRGCLRLAGALVGPYKDRKLLAALTSRPYISPRAQIKCARLEVGPQVFIDDEVVIYGHEHGGRVALGPGVHVYRGTIIEVGHGGSVLIGQGTHIQAHCNLKGFVSDLRIGAQVQIAPQCAFSPYEHNFDDLSRPIQAQGLRSKGPIVIEDDAWLGVGVRVLEGVTIGRGAIIGAGAVVTQDIPPYAIAVGVPARVIGTRGGKPVQMA
ncbi:MAG: acyltransferase [Anaerolineae bacterium]|nr:acyltransferase [Anaerolineae bacterium]